ncbi:MAG TPA: tetratricopeptide repeat protein [Ktedonobacteraceae bacterium]
MGRYEEALRDFDRVIMLDERDAWALASRGQVYRAMKRYGEALRDFDRAIMLDEKYAWAMAQRGQVYQAMERYGEALRDFDRAIVLNEKWNWVIAQRGRSYRLMGRYEEALRDFDRAIALDEKYFWAMAQRGQVYRAMKRYEEALADFDRVIALNKHSDWAWYNRALVDLLMGQLVAFHQHLSFAVTVAQSRLEDYPSEGSDFYRLRFNIALYMFVDGSVEIAKNDYVRLISTCQIPERLQTALGGLKEFLTIQPAQHELFQPVVHLLEGRLKELVGH